MASITKITAYLKENQKKQETNQIWLFDMWTSHENLKFHLEKAIPMTFEEKIKWERDMIWYSVTWHWLDWLKKYLIQKSIGLENVYAFKKKMSEKVVELKEFSVDEWWENFNTTTSVSDWQKSEEIVDQNIEEVVKPKEKKVRQKDIKVRFFWLVTFIRKIQTKSWKMMLIASCDSTTFKFNVLIFPRDYEKFANVIHEYKVLLVDWNLQFNEEMEEIAVIPNNIRSTTIWFLREQAIDLWVFDENDKINYLADEEEILLNAWNEEKTEKKNDKDSNSKPDIKKWNDDKDLEIKVHTIKVPTSAKKEDLMDLKEFLLTQAEWIIKVFLDIKWQIIDTKIMIERIESLEDWTSKKWDY